MKSIKAKLDTIMMWWVNRKNGIKILTEDEYLEITSKYKVIKVIYI